MNIMYNNRHQNDNSTTSKNNHQNTVQLLDVATSSSPSTSSSYRCCLETSLGTLVLTGYPITDNHHHHHEETTTTTTDPVGTASASFQRSSSRQRIRPRQISPSVASLSLLCSRSSNNNNDDGHMDEPFIALPLFGGPNTNARPVKKKPRHDDDDSSTSGIYATLPKTITTASSHHQRQAQPQEESHYYHKLVQWAQSTRGLQRRLEEVLVTQQQLQQQKQKHQRRKRRYHFENYEEENDEENEEEYYYDDDDDYLHQHPLQVFQQQAALVFQEFVRAIHYQTTRLEQENENEDVNHPDTDENDYDSFGFQSMPSRNSSRPRRRRLAHLQKVVVALERLEQLHTSSRSPQQQEKQPVVVGNLTWNQKGDDKNDGDPYQVELVYTDAAERNHTLLVQLLGLYEDEEDGGENKFGSKEGDNCTLERTTTTKKNSSPLRIMIRHCRAALPNAATQGFPVPLLVKDAQEHDSDEDASDDDSDDEIIHTKTSKRTREDGDDFVPATAKNTPLYDLFEEYSLLPSPPPTITITGNKDTDDSNVHPSPSLLPLHVQLDNCYQAFVDRVDRLQNFWNDLQDLDQHSSQQQHHVNDDDIFRSPGGKQQQQQQHNGDNGDELGDRITTWRKLRLPPLLSPENNPPCEAATTAAAVVLRLSVDPLNPRRLPESYRFSTTKGSSSLLTRTTTEKATGEHQQLQIIKARFQANLRAGLWNDSTTLRENLERCLEMPLLAQLHNNDSSHDENSSADMNDDENKCAACGICYTSELPAEEDEERLVSQFPTIVCDNPSCGRGYHPSCLQEWLLSLPTSRITFDLIVGDCPYCQESLAAPLPGI